MGGNMSKKVKDRVYASKQGGSTDLNLDDCDLFKFPLQLLTLRSLETLDLSHNHLPALTNDIHKLSKLNVLKVGYNELEMLPDTLYRLHLRYSLHTAPLSPHTTSQSAGLLIQLNERSP